MNEHYFSTWSPNMAYFLGLIFADGSVSNKLHRLSLGLVTSDEYILESFRDEIKHPFPISREPGRTRRDGGTVSPFSKVTITSQIMVDELFRHGIVPRKSYCDVDYPQVPDEFTPDFIRGHFDGDGSIFVTGQGYPKITIVGSKRFMTGLAAKIGECCTMPVPSVKPHTVSNVAYFIDISKRNNVINFLNFIYPIPDQGLFLKRKRDKANLIINQIESDLSKQGYGRKGKYWRVRKNCVEVGLFKTEEEAVFARDIIFGRKSANGLIESWQKDIVAKLEVKGVIPCQSEEFVFTAGRAVAKVR